MKALWEQSDFRMAAGRAWRPGDAVLTRHALDWCAGRGLLPSGGVAVDMGCGAGATLELLASLGLRAIGIDARAGLEAADDADTLPPSIRRIRADVARPPLAASCADLILFECVLSLLPEPSAALRAACRALTPGGLCLVSDLTRRDAAHAAGGTASCLSGARTAEGWRSLLTDAGLRILREEDHSRALAELAARLVWYGVAGQEAFAARGACGCAGATPRKSHGYCLWIARKEETCTP